MIRFLFVLEWLLRFVHLGAALRVQKFNSNCLKSHLDFSQSNYSVFIHMATFNGQDTVAQSIESVLCQTHRNWFLFISDDASTDDTWSLVEGFARRDERIKAMRLDENMTSEGLSIRNLGLDEFDRGAWDFFTVLDQDDMAESDWLSNCLRLDWSHITALRMWNARYDGDLREKKYEYPAAAQIMVPKLELKGLRARRGYGVPGDSDFLYHLEFRAIKRFKAVVVAPFLCQKMRFTEFNQTANPEAVTIGRWGFFWRYFWSA